MKIWIITQNCCSEFVSAWASEEAAQKETDRLNADYQRQFNRENFGWDEDTLNV
ncbi:hypothetical protein [Streptomyces sp. NBC_01751]|uniref:hypothetical protein n=1 Tax=Streptomyces sp. NBC_01751 TaxID=2975929 RepID=UPI002DD7D6EC|nr:hypothetical protein [Streptomyces sp. NBC_01751]WSD24576.1 hypothetical protein OHA26_14375 [Streptomyces sp. NBC_01751]